MRGLWFDTSLGLRTEADRIGFDLGLGLRQLSTSDDDQFTALGSVWGHQNTVAMVPHFDASLRYSLTERLALWAGPRLDYVDSRLVSLDRYANGSNSISLGELFPGASIRLGFSAGLAFAF